MSQIPTNSMYDFDPFSDLVYEEQTHLAKGELCSFIAVVKETYGPEQARLSAMVWLEESELIDGPPRSETRNWHAVTIAATARFANRIQVKAASVDVEQSAN